MMIVSQILLIVVMSSALSSVVAAPVFLLVQIVESLADSKAADALLPGLRCNLYGAGACGDAGAVVQPKPLLHNMCHSI